MYSKHNLFTGVYKTKKSGHISLPKKCLWQAYMHSDGKFSLPEHGEKGKICLILEDDNSSFWPVMSFMTDSEAEHLSTKLIEAVKQTNKSKDDPTPWQPMSKAPRDGTLILVWHDHESDPYYEQNGQRLTIYGSWAEGLGHETEAGMYIAYFGGEDTEELSGEGYGPHVTYPSWWFKHDNEEMPLAPVLWMPLPHQPKKTEFTNEQMCPGGHDVIFPHNLPEEDVKNQVLEYFKSKWPESSIEEDKEELFIHDNLSTKKRIDKNGVIETDNFVHVISIKNELTVVFTKLDDFAKRCQEDIVSIIVKMGRKNDA